MTAPSAAAPSPAAPLLLRDSVGGGVVVLTLNRPAARNSLSTELITELRSALDWAAGDASVRALVLAANGPAFSAGHDLKELIAHRDDADGGEAWFAELMVSCCAMMQAIVALPKPVVAAVQGIATAAGCQLVATCDLAVASERASFATPGVDIGLFCLTPMVPLSRNVPRKQAMEMLLTGEPVSAIAARDMGLINRVVPAGTELDEAILLAQKIAGKSAYTIGLGKATFYRQLEMSLADAYRCGSQAMLENIQAEDAAEGIGAFIAKRAPQWKDR